YRNSRNTQFLTCTYDSYCYFSTISNQNFILLYHNYTNTNKTSSNPTTSPFLKHTESITPSYGDVISFIIFIASTMQTTCPFLTESPIFTNGLPFGVLDS